LVSSWKAFLAITVTQIGLSYLYGSFLFGLVCVCGNAFTLQN